MMHEYELLKTRLASGWNTWNARSILSHVWLGPSPDEDKSAAQEPVRGGLALNIGLLSYRDSAYLKETLPGREDVRLGAHSFDGAYTDLTLRWHDVELRVESAHDGPEIVLLITPGYGISAPGPLIVEGALLWNRPGCVQRVGDTLVGHVGERTVTIYCTAPTVEEPDVPATGAYLAIPIDGEIGLASGRRKTLNEIKAAIITRRAEHHRRRTQFGKLGDVYEAVESPAAWNTIYDPGKRRVISPASRLECVDAGGYLLGGEATLLAALLAAIDSKEAAYANAIEIVRQMVWERDPLGKSPAPSDQFRLGFSPSVTMTHGAVTGDRSHAPVASYVFRELYRRFQEKWPLTLVFDDLLAWNRWWANKRDIDGLLAWGSQPYEPSLGSPIETDRVGLRAGALRESGMERSPLYENAAFDADRHLLLIGDAALTGLYIWDCDSLSAIAQILGRSEAIELKARADRYRGNYSRLWNEADGAYYNRRVDSGQRDTCRAAVSLYALLARVPTQEQAERMVASHLLNPQEYGGEWAIPTLAREDRAFDDSVDYAGRIAPATNFLVYVGLGNYDLPDARAELAAKSEALLMRDWRRRRHVHASYSALTGDGCDAQNPRPFSHLGSLLGLIVLMQAGH